MNQPSPANEVTPVSPEIRKAYNKYVEDVRVRNSRVACALDMVLMPAGFTLDLAVYPGHFGVFLLNRFITSLLAGLVFLQLRRPNLSPLQSRLLCTGWYVLPAASISCMIAMTGGMTSTYYAGLNLVILAVSSVIQATLEESIVAVVVVVSMYCVACLADLKSWNLHLLFNNLYFISLTATIVVTGNYFFNRLRFREFLLRYELDKSRSQLADSNEKLKELGEIKNRFFANISHELRTPLTLLISPLESLIVRYNQPGQEDTRNLLVTMQANGMRLLKLINDLLDLVRLESGVMQVKQDAVEVTEFVKGLASSAKQVADDKKLKLETSVDPALGVILTDRDKLEKIVLNLVFNALKFTSPGGRVTLKAEKQGSEVALSVEDTGMGISEKNLAHVFDRFWQADNSSKRKFQGVGIGLALVKELVEVQSGTVAVASKEGVGTTFTIKLPYLDGSAALAQSKSAALEESKAIANGNQSGSQEWLANLYRRAELFPAMKHQPGEAAHPVANGNGSVNGDRRPTLLVADDEPDMLRFLKSQLSTHYNVIDVVDGAQAVIKAAEFLPDIILLDMMMPEKDGMQACRELREMAATQTTPIIMLTARADEETKLNALSTGANDFLPKPFSTTELHVRIKNLVESHHYQLEVTKQNEQLAKTIEQLKETETLLVQTEKMASLGRMSAGIIHEINNPLNYATTGLYTLRNKAKYLATEQQTEYTEVLQEVEEGIGRVKNIITDLRSFTHPDTEQFDQVEVRPLVGLSLRFLSNELKGHVKVEQKIPEHFLIRGNRNKLVQVFVNMLQNSLDTLRRKNFENGEEPTISIEAREENGKKLIILRDNGEGMSAETVAKVFDPFFTTKDVGEGMGLGLTICYRIVEEYEGRITVSSEPGKFCEFRLEFPGVAVNAN